VVHRERTTDRLTDSSTARQVGSALGDAQRVAAAGGVLMALHPLSAAQARQLLARAGDPHAPAAGGTSPTRCCAPVVCRGNATLQAATDELCDLPLMTDCHPKAQPKVATGINRWPPHHWSG
jgi:hypothetical protein